MGEHKEAHEMNDRERLVEIVEQHDVIAKSFDWFPHYVHSFDAVLVRFVLDLMDRVHGLELKLKLKEALIDKELERRREDAAENLTEQQRRPDR